MQHDQNLHVDSYHPPHMAFHGVCASRTGNGTLAAPYKHLPEFVVAVVSKFLIAKKNIVADEFPVALSTQCCERGIRDSPSRIQNSLNSFCFLIFYHLYFEKNQ